jgi:hypothetical protein
MFTFGMDGIGSNRLGSRRRNEKFFGAINTFTLVSRRKGNVGNTLFDISSIKFLLFLMSIISSNISLV